MTAALLIFLGGLIFSSALSRRAQKKGPLLLLILSSYGLRVLLTLSFFIISAWQLPILPELQIEGGFWQFAPDAASYHSGAAQTAEAWGQGEPLSFSGSWYVFLVALLYHVSGPPLSMLHCSMPGQTPWRLSLAIFSPSGLPAGALG